IEELKIPTTARDHLGIGMKRMIDFLLAPDGDFGSDPMRGRDEFLLRALAGGMQDLRDKLGSDMNGWVYGQAEYKHALIRHPLSPAVDAATRDRLDVGPLPRGGNGYTLGATGGGDNQTSGASFRILVDTRDWDNTLGMNTPGQVGDPDSPLYDNLFELWATDRLFPAFYSRDKIESVAFERLELRPGR
ncbi:MAG: penicillin acylase family protein, partial [Gemmatimonadota bacterium]|nr:penicillin acylase family protein [Gemmatimonadota bacterium]